MPLKAGNSKLLNFSVERHKQRPPVAGLGKLEEFIVVPYETGVCVHERRERRTVVRRCCDVSDDGGNKLSEAPSPKATRLLDINSYFE